MGTYDAIDRAILERLQLDGRIPNTELADAVKLSPSACLRRVKAMEQDGLIAGYRADVDRHGLGLGITVFIELKVQGHSQQTSAALERELTAIPAVVACHVISGAADFLLEVAVHDLGAYERVLLDKILVNPAVVEARSTFAIRTVLTRGPLPLETMTRR